MKMTTNDSSPLGEDVEELSRCLTADELQSRSQMVDGALARLNGSAVEVQHDDRLIEDELRICEQTKCDPQDFRRLKAERSENLFEARRQREAAIVAGSRR
jgi:hypothetical protein